MKSRLLLAFVLSAMLILITACESGGTIRIINRSSYPVYVRMEDGAEAVIAGGGVRSYDIDTGTQSFLTGTVEKAVRVHLVGETYQIYNQYNHSYVDTTEVYVLAGKTVPIYIDPNRASIKIINNSVEDTITNVEIYRHNFINPTRIANLGQILPGGSVFYHINPSVPTNSAVLPWIPTPATNFYYYVKVILSDGSFYQYGGEDKILYKDQQYLISYTPAR